MGSGGALGLLATSRRGGTLEEQATGCFWWCCNPNSCAFGQLVKALLSFFPCNTAPPGRQQFSYKIKRVA